MSVGDLHTIGPEGYALCGASGPLRGYNATSQPCRDCQSLSSPGFSGWTTAAPATSRGMPYFNGHHAANALLRKRPTRLLRNP